MQVHYEQFYYPLYVITVSVALYIVFTTHSLYYLDSRGQENLHAGKILAIFATVPYYEIFVTVHYK